MIDSSYRDIRDLDQLNLSTHPNEENLERSYITTRKITSTIGQDKNMSRVDVSVGRGDERDSSVMDRSMALKKTDIRGSKNSGDNVFNARP